MQVQVIRRELNKLRKKDDYHKCEIRVEPTYLTQGMNINDGQFVSILT